jgi:Carboxypeptidase regulatory-like domain/TonB dependent receptor
MRKGIVVFCIALLIAGLATTVVNGQTQYGSVRGVVKDPQGSSVADAKILLKNTATNTETETVTNGDGIFTLGNVAPSDYELTIQKDGFRTMSSRLTIGVAENVSLTFSLELGKITETVTVSELSSTINTTSAELGKEITSKELDSLPMLTRNPYSLAAFTAGASDTGSVTGDTRGLGLAINGQRAASTNFMLDGAENNDTFVAGVGQTVPLDSVQEFKIQSSSTTAEFGRNAVQINVSTKSGTNDLHGSLYEYYRGAGLSTATFDDNARGLPKANFVRNQFGASAGGPLIKDKIFYFGSFEGLRIRSSATQQYFVPTTDWFNSSSSTAQGFLSAFGGVPASNCADQAITAQDVVETIEGGGPGSYATSPLLDQGGAPIPAATQLFCRDTLRRPTDSGGGLPENTWLATGRVDYHISKDTSFFARYAFDKEDDFAGTVSFSPFPGFSTGQNIKNQNASGTITHSFSPSLYSELRLTYNRVNNLQPLGQAPATTPCWQYDLFNNTGDFGGQLIIFPGYSPDVCSFAGIPFGGPQNIYQLHNGWTLAKGKHTIKWGGGYLHLRDNRTFGAYEGAYFDSFTMQDMLNGQVDLTLAAVDPKGHVTGETYCISEPCPTGSSLDGPLQFPSFTRHFHYNELSFYGEDSWKVTSRLTITAGLRYEYFGVLHSPENERFLDANLYLNAVGTPDVNTPLLTQIANARFRRTNQFYKPDYKNWGPRASFAYDFFGNGRTVLRSGYGIYYDRNFGNATFNAIQNPPNYAVVTLGLAAPIMPNQFDTLSSAGGTFVVSSSSRMLDNDLKTAYSEQWNTTLEHDFFGKGIIGSVSYVGANGIHLYSLNNLNQRGACLLVTETDPTFPCNPAGGNSSRINQSGLTGMNRRGNEGLSRYSGLSTEVKTRSLGKTGLILNANYTWSHSIDNESSFFADSSFESLFGFGFKDPFNPGADRADSSNDIRHRFSASYVWALPFGSNWKGIAGSVLGGWTVSGTFVAQTGATFSVYDGSSASQCNNSGTNFCSPVQAGALPSLRTVDTGQPNSFNLYDLSNTYQTQEAYCANNAIPTSLGTFGGVGSDATSQLSCTAALYVLHPELLAGRNQFRTPGIWTTNFAVLKDFRMPWKESHRLQLRGEFYNLFNHSNLYASPGTNVFTGDGSFVQGQRGVPNCAPATCGAERRNIQVAVRYLF